MTQRILKVLELRDKWLYRPSKSLHVGALLGHGEISLDVEKMKKMNKFPKSIEDEYECKFIRGIMKITNRKTQQELFEERTFDEYQNDLAEIMNLVSFGPAKTMCYRRLKILESRFTLHLWLNDYIEVAEVKSIPHRDFYNVRKIDNHVHHSACMHQV